MKDKKKIVIISVCCILLILLIVLIGLIINFNKKDRTSDTSANIYDKVPEKQVRSFEDVKLIEDLLKGGKVLDSSIGNELGDEEKEILRSLGVNEVLFDTYKIYTSEELLNSNFISSEDEGEDIVEEWENNYKDETYIISQNQELAFLVNGRNDEKDRIQYARLVDNIEIDQTTEDETQGNEEIQESELIEENTIINIRKVERLKYKVDIDYPENAQGPQYAIKVKNNEIQNQVIEESEEVQENEDIGQSIEMDYENLEWKDYDQTIFIEENVTIYTKYKLIDNDLEIEVINFKEVPELILSTPTYEIVEDENEMYIKFFNKESGYNDNVIFKVSHGTIETEGEITYSDWYEIQYNKFIVEDITNYSVKFKAFMKEKNVTDSKEGKISVGRYEQVFIPKSSNANINSIEINSVTLPQSIIDLLNENGTADYKLTSVNSITVKANPEDTNASVTGDGIYNFKNNKSTVNIKIVAEDGTERLYTLNITRNASLTNTIKGKNTNTGEINIPRNYNSGNSTPSNSNPDNSTPNNSTPNNSTPSDNNPSNNNPSGNSSNNNTTCNHVWNEATCTTPKTCSKCGLKEGSVNSSNHSNYGTTSKVTTIGTCKIAEVTTNYCKGCGKEVSTTQGNKNPDNHSNYGTTPKVTTQATCTVAEVKSYYCNGCNNVIKTETGKALGHDYSKKTITSQYLKSSATCTTPATYYYACSRCGAKGTSTYTYGKALGHDLRSRECLGEYCNRSGCSYSTGYSSHDFSEKSNKYKCSNATCTSAATYYYTCSHCGAKGTSTYSSGSALGHNWLPATCTESKRCSRCNTTTGSPLLHLSYSFGTCRSGTHLKCTRSGCGETSGQRTHIPSGSVTNGKFTCSACGKKFDTSTKTVLWTNASD